MLVKLILLCLIGFVVGQNNPKSRYGIIPDPGEFPFALCIIGDNRCSGVLVKPDVFLSAGHCFWDDMGNKMNIANQRAVMGVIDIRKRTDHLLQKRKIVDFKHPDGFKPNASENDIAAGYLDKPFEMTYTVGVAKIVSSDPNEFKSAWYNIVKNGEKCRGMGWGRTYIDPPINKTEILSNELRYIWVLPLPDSNCSEVVKSRTGIDWCGKGLVAAVTTDPNDDSLRPGDSGGPFVCGEYVYGTVRGGMSKTNPVINTFMILFPYIEYFEIGASTKIYSNTYTIISLLIFQHLKNFCI